MSAKHFSNVLTFIVIIDLVDLHAYGEAHGTSYISLNCNCDIYLSACNSLHSYCTNRFSTKHHFVGIELQMFLTSRAETSVDRPSTVYR